MGPQHRPDTRPVGLWSSVADVVLGRSCAGCEEPGTVLCAACAEHLTPTPRLRRSLDMGEISAGLHVPVACSLDYRGSVRHALYRYKDHRIPQLAGIFGAVLASSVEFVARHADVPPTHMTLAVVPTRKATLRRRGFDSLGLIAEAAQRRGRFRGTCTPLRDIRRAGHAKTLGVSDRQQVAAGAFELTSRVPAGPVVIVDDVVTTGATVREAAATLMLAGIHVVAVATVAGTP